MTPTTFLKYYTLLNENAVPTKLNKWRLTPLKTERSWSRYKFQRRNEPNTRTCRKFINEWSRPPLIVMSYACVVYRVFCKNLAVIFCISDESHWRGACGVCCWRKTLATNVRIMQKQKNLHWNNSELWLLIVINQ